MAKKPSEPDFKSLSKEERAARVRELMAKGHSNKSAAKALGITEGAVAGIRHRHNIPSKNEPGFERNRERTLPPPPKLAASERTQCFYVHEGRRCAYEREPAMQYCRLHLPKR